MASRLAIARRNFLLVLSPHLPDLALAITGERDYDPLASAFLKFNFM
jgi:hypothetical protein